MPPLTFLGISKGKWKLEDAALAMAVRIYETTMVCSCCGIPTRLAHNPDNDGWYEIDENTICYAGAARDEWQKNQQNNDPTPGVLPHIIYTR